MGGNGPSSSEHKIEKGEKWMPLRCRRGNVPGRNLIIDGPEDLPEEDIDDRRRNPDLKGEKRNRFRRHDGEHDSQ